MFKVINISGATLGLMFVKKGYVTQDNLSDKDYRVVSKLTEQIKHLADPSVRLLKIIKMTNKGEED